MKNKHYILSFIALIFLFAINVGYATALDDAATTAKIKVFILRDPVLSKLDVKVETNDQVVKLSGKVDTDNQASKLVEIAQSIADVKDVDTSDLQIKKSDQPASDVLITAKVYGLFLREKLFGDKDVSAFSIHVNTNNGIVTLTGTADSENQVNNAIALAKSVKGVSSVQSDVTVNKNS
jgi:hyperosmotically inducible protein